MSKLSLRLLLSGASSIAIAAALAHTPAVAAQVFGPGVEQPIVISADTNFVQVTNATVLADALDTAFVIETGVTIASTSGSAVAFSQSTFLGSVVNNGRITGDDAFAWSITSSTIDGNLINNGVVIGGAAGAGNGHGAFIADTLITGDIVNTGTFQGGSGVGANGLAVFDSTVGGDVINSGIMKGATSVDGSNGLRVEETSIVGAIRNDSGGSIVGGSANAISGEANGIVITNDSLVGGGIFNSGSISGGAIGKTRNGILINLSTVAGGIHNNEGATIAGGTNGTAIAITNSSVVTDGIVNDGTIRSQQNGISIDFNSFVSGGITNNTTGSIVGGGEAGIKIVGSTFTDGILNDGWITGGENGAGIYVFGSVFSGGIHNSANGSIVGDGFDAITIFGSTTFAGDVLNEGHIDAVNADGIDIDLTKLDGALSNAGLITSTTTGIRVVGFIADGIFNSGTIEAPVAININGAVGQTITQTSGKILGDIIFSQVGESFFVGKGGYFKGLMQGTHSDNDDITVMTGTWSAEGTGDGLGDITVASGRGVFGGRFYGDLEGIGFDVTDTTNFITTAGRAYVDDDSKMGFSNDLSFGAEGTLEFLLTSDVGRHGTLISTDDAFLGGRIAGYFAWNSFAGLGNTQDFAYQYFVQTADLVGTFINEDNVDTNSVFFTAQAVHRDDQFVDMNAHRIGFDEIVPSPTASQQAVGDALEEIYANGGAPFLALEDPNGDGIENPQEESEGLYSALFQLATAGVVGDAYGSLDGHDNAAIFQTAFTIASLFDRNIQSRLEDARDQQGGTRSAAEPKRYAAATIIAVDGASGAARGSSGWSAWARAFGSWGNADGDAQNEGFDQESKGFGFGVDYAPGGGSLIGLAGQFASTDLEFDRPVWAPVGADADIDSWQVALYGYHSFGTLFIDGNASAAFNDTTSRRADFWGQPIIANYDSTVYSVYGELGADLNSGRFNFQPFAGVGFRHADFDNFTERCPLFCLAIAPDDAESLYSALGVRASATYRWGRTPITPELRLAWEHEFSDDRGAFDAAFVGAPGSPFHVEGQRFADDKFIVGAGVSAEVARNFVLFAEYNGSFSSDFDAHSVAGGLRVTW